MIAELGQEVLGDYLIGLQAGNEPDYYQPYASFSSPLIANPYPTPSHGHRPEGYDPQAYFEEFADLIRAVQANDRITNKNMLIGPSLASGPWTPESVWDTGYLDAYGQYLTAVTMEQCVTLSLNCSLR